VGWPRDRVVEQPLKIHSHSAHTYVLLLPARARPSSMRGRPRSAPTERANSECSCQYTGIVDCNRLRVLRAYPRNDQPTAIVDHVVKAAVRGRSGPDRRPPGVRLRLPLAPARQRRRTRPQQTPHTPSERQRGRPHRVDASRHTRRRRFDVAGRFRPPSGEDGDGAAARPPAHATLPRA
jgi:hypothetical protein